MDQLQIQKAHVDQFTFLTVGWRSRSHFNARFIVPGVHRFDTVESRSLNGVSATNSKSEAVTMTNGLQELVASRFFSTFIIAVIVVNAITLGLETSPTIVNAIGPVLHTIDTAALWIFTIECC